MDRARTTIVRYLEEAHATEAALQRELETQIAMTPSGAYRDDLERHLRETRDHAARVRRRARELGVRRDPLRFAVGVAETAVGQVVALGRGPLVLLRGRGGEEKLLKNAKDAAASEALEIATYTAIERLATSVGDTETAKLAASIRRDEERMLERIREHLGTLTDDVARAQFADDPSYDPSRTGAADAARATAKSARSAAKKGGKAARRQARRVPGATQVEGEVRGAAASADDLPIRGYDDLTADEVVRRLGDLSQLELGIVDAYERRHAERSTVLDRIGNLRTSEPWAGYDEATASDIRARLADADETARREVRDYERAHKARQSVLAATERQPASTSS